MWGVSYTSAGAAVAGIVRGSESYSGRVAHQNAEAKTVGQISVKAPTSASFTTDVNTIIAATAINTAMGGSPGMIV